MTVTLEDKRILVTGGAGFLGRQVIAQLCQAGADLHYSEDAARGVVMGTQLYNDPEPVNLGTGYEISIQDLVELICELMVFDGEIVWETDKPNGQPRRCLDVERARQAFGFVAQVDFRQGLRNTIDWYRQYAEL